MSNYLKMSKRQQVIALLEMGWTYRRIEAETGVRRETVSRYDRWRQSKAAKVFPGSDGTEFLESPGKADPEGSKPAKVFPGSPPNAAKVFAGSGLPERCLAARYRDAIIEKLELELSCQRIWQDLVEEYGYGGSYESVKRYVRRLERPRHAVGIYHSAPGEEGQVDFFRGAPTLNPHGQWSRPWVFRMTLCHSRHGYEEAVWDQQIETFLRCHENAFLDFGGVPAVVRHDNLKAAVVRACLFDPDSNDIFTAFAKHWGFTSLPTKPATPRENGKQERSGGYVKDNALKGRKFEGGLDECNDYLRHWNRTIARLRIHGTTRKQVWTHFLETDRKALQPLPTERFTFFESGMRTVHRDSHVEVKGSFYPVPLDLVKRDVRVRWDRKLVRVYYGEKLVAVHNRIAPGLFAPRPGGSPLELTSTQRAWQENLLGRCQRIGAPLRKWAELAIEERGVRAYRLIQGVLGLTRSYPRERVLSAAQNAIVYRLFRYRDLKRIAAMPSRSPAALDLTDEHESIRPMTQYRLEDLV